MSTNTMMFPGCADVYVQYHDILGTPMFSVLQDIIQGKLVPGLYHTGPLGRISLEELMQWYLLRPRFNFLQIPALNVHQFTEEQNDKMMEQLLSQTSYDTFPLVNLVNAFFLHPVVEHLHVFSLHQESSIKQQIEKMRKNVQVLDYRFGSVESVIQDAKSHATLITTSTAQVRRFLSIDYPHRYAYLIYPNGYDPIQNISDIYFQYSDRLGVIDIRNRLEQWKEYV